MGSAVSDPARGRQSRPSPRTNRGKRLIVEKQNCHIPFCSIKFYLFLAHGVFSVFTWVVVPNSNLFQVAQVHCLHSELVDHPVFKLILVGLTSLQVDDPCERCDVIWNSDWCHSANTMHTNSSKSVNWTISPVSSFSPNRMMKTSESVPAYFFSPVFTLIVYVVDMAVRWMWQISTQIIFIFTHRYKFLFTLIYTCMLH